jgi:hypothetical protein
MDEKFMNTPTHLPFPFLFFFNLLKTQKNQFKSLLKDLSPHGPRKLRHLDLQNCPHKTTFFFLNFVKIIFTKKTAQNTSHGEQIRREMHYGLL